MVRGGSESSLGPGQASTQLYHRLIGYQKASAGGTDPLRGYWPTRLALYCFQRKGHTLQGWTKSLVLCWPQGLVARKGVGELHYQVEMRVDTLPWYAHSHLGLFGYDLVLEIGAVNG